MPGDRFGIKPLYYTVAADTLYFASEAKALLPFLREIETDSTALAEYLTFQYTIGEHTLSQGHQAIVGRACLGGGERRCSYLALLGRSVRD